MKTMISLSVLSLTLLTSCGGETVSHMTPEQPASAGATTDSSVPPGSLQNNIPTH